MKRAETPDATLVCAPMDVESRDAALALLAEFLEEDTHYLASSAVYGGGGREALARALDLFITRPELGFVWLAFSDAPGKRIALGGCVVCYAISTSRGTLVAKLDDVTIASAWRGRGVGRTMLSVLADYLRARGITRIDTACHRDNGGAWRFYERLGYRPLDEERISLLLA